MPLIIDPITPEPFEKCLPEQRVAAGWAHTATDIANGSVTDSNFMDKKTVFFMLAAICHYHGGCAPEILRADLALTLQHGIDVGWDLYGLSAGIQDEGHRQCLVDCDR